MATFPALDFTRLDISKVRLPKVELPDVPLPTVRLPGLPKVPATVDLPRIELPDIDTDRVAGAARDAAYVGVGLAVLGFQRAQVRRRQVTEAVKDGVGQLRESLR